MTTGARVEMEDPFGLVGSTLDGQYRVDEVVGEGGYGVVYRGWHLALEQPIAVKALKVPSAEDRAVQDALFAKFKDEAKLLYTLSQASLHIVRSMDFGATTTPSGVWAPYMVLEWLAGRSLAEDLAARRQQGLHGRSVAEALALLEQAAKGLSVAHHRRVAHRDIKPANLFLLDANAPSPSLEDGLQVKVLDFGIAKIIRDGDGPGTRSPFPSFTWLYAAPEQLDPRIGATGLATDVYSYALLLTELLTDRIPTEGRDVVALLKAAVDPTTRPTPRQRGANVPDALEGVCLRALAVDPRERFATIDELWQALDGARRPSRTAPPPPMHPPSHPSRSSPAIPPHTPAPFQSPLQPYPYGPPAPLPVHPTPPPPMHSPMHPAFTAGRMTPPPGSPRYPPQPPRPLRPVAPPSSLPLVLAVIGVVLGLMFVATCAAVHAAC